MTAQFTTTRRVEFADTDRAGIVHFANFYRYMEEAEDAFFGSLGLHLNNPQADGSIIGWPRVAASCSFEAPAYHEDVLEIRLSVVRKGVKSLTMNFEFWRDETRIAYGQLKTACCLCRQGEPLTAIEIPEEYGQKIDEAGEPDQST